MLQDIEKLNPYVLSLLVLAIWLLLYMIYNFKSDSLKNKIYDEGLLNSFLNGKNHFDLAKTTAESINPNVVDDIFHNTDTKSKGDQLEDLTRNIYRMLGYRAKTVREMKARGEAPWLTGVDQGGDVIAELYNEAGECIERLMIQCKAYKNLDDESGNKAVQQAHFAMSYYSEKMGVPFDKALLVTTSHRMSVPAMDAAKTTGVEIINYASLKKLIARANAKLFQRSLKQQ